MSNTVITDSAKLRAAINLVSPCRGKFKPGQNMDIFLCYMFKVIPDVRLTVLTMDGHGNCIAKEVPIERGGEHGTYYVYGPKLKKLLNLIPNEPIQITFMHSQVEIKTARGEYYIAVLDTLQEEAKESVEIKGKLRLEIPDFRKWLKYTSFCASIDEIRQQMCGVHFDTSGGHLQIAATDGKLLTHIDAVSVETDFDDNFTIPNNSIKYLSRSLPETGMLDVEIYQKIIEFTTGAENNRTFITNSLERGLYPNYKAVIPSEEVLWPVKLNRRELHSAAQRASLMASDISNLIVLSLLAKDNKIRLSSKNHDEDTECQETIDAQYTHNDAANEQCPDRLGFHGRRLISVLYHLPADDITMFVKNSYEPTVFRPSNRKEDDDKILYLLMNMRICDDD